MIVLHALLQSALVGAGRTAFALLPPDPLAAYAGFEKLLLMRPDDQYLATARQQNDALQDGGPQRGDGAVMTGAADVIGAALAAAPEYPDGNRQLQREHIIWLWNTYSGAAHTYAWPQLLPSSGPDRRVPGDFPGDFFMVATTAHIAMPSLQSRLQSGSANTTAPVPMQSEPPKSR